MMEYEFEPELSQLSSVRSLIGQACRKAWKTEENEAIDQLLLAVQEAGTNIIRHGYCNSDTKKIHLGIQTTRNDVTVIFTYPGRPFDPHDVPVPSFDGKQEGGYGIYLIKKLVDQVHYGQDANGACQIHLHQKRIPKSQGE